MKTTFKPKKHFSQNFLKDPRIIAEIVQVLNLKPQDQVIEIGPGMGALTFALPKVASFAAVELDREAIAYLKVQRPDLQIHEGDVLKFDFGQFSQPIRVIGNLPYHISTPILFHLIDYAAKIIDLTFMLQKEVVDRMAAAENTEDYGRLSVMIQYHCQVEKLFEVPPEAFYPKPAVDSAMVRLTPHLVKPFLAQDEAKFSAIVAQAFSQRRKMLRRSLKGLVSPAAFDQAGVDANARPENISLADFVALANKNSVVETPL